MKKLYSYERDDKGRRIKSRCFLYHDENNYAVGQAICHEKDINLGKNRHKRGREIAEERATRALNKKLHQYFKVYHGKHKINKKNDSVWKAVFKPGHSYLTWRERRFLDKQKGIVY